MTHVEMEVQVANKYRELQSICFSERKRKEREGECISRDFSLRSPPSRL